jgi:hypothetical protein
VSINKGVPNMKYPNWTSAIRSPYLMDWAKHPKFIPKTPSKSRNTDPVYDYMESYYNTVRHPDVPLAGIDTDKSVSDTSQVLIDAQNDSTIIIPSHIESARKIQLSWNLLHGENAWVDTHYHPSHIGMIWLERHLKDNVFHRNDWLPAITINDLHLSWNDYSFCQSKTATYRPGPEIITINNYKEFWSKGKFIRNSYTSIFYQWVGGLNLLETNNLDGDNNLTWYPINKSAKLTVNQKKLYDLLNTLQAPATPFENRFFNSDTDEFRFMDIMHRILNE